ncbi:putative sodium-coupled neutral amino acid transporter [Phytophthora cinnamomi]|uniref:putative sodium-coupled neutral amino acid transporter n=1 Tax=Phytophthora cinnamomi TaxID=4785 RepID=UPI00355A9BE0|nr:putative sodium-coupled neutral amino acid transporter [Phytophthora cinnamomi]
MAASNPLERIREQRAMKLLGALQDDLRAQMRLEKDELGRNGENKRASVRRKERITRLSDPHERERIWIREQLPSWHTLCIARERDETFPVRAPRRVLEASASVNKDSAGGFVYSFGSGLQGQLGLGKQKLAALPTCIPTLRHRHVRCRSIAVSSHHSCALAVDGNLYTWGQNVSGSLGRKGSDVGATDLPEPGVVDRGRFRNYGVGPIVSIAAGHGFTLFATGPWEPREEPSKPQFQLQTAVNRHTNLSRSS